MSVRPEVKPRDGVERESTAVVRGLSVYTPDGGPRGPSVRSTVPLDHLWLLEPVPRSRLAGAFSPRPFLGVGHGVGGRGRRRRKVPDALYLFNKTIIAGIRVIDLSFGVDHINDLWLAEDEKWDEERLWGRPEDDSETNTDSEAEDALEFMLAFA